MHQAVEHSPGECAAVIHLGSHGCLSIIGTAYAPASHVDAPARHRSPCQQANSELSVMQYVCRQVEVDLLVGQACVTCDGSLRLSCWWGGQKRAEVTVEVRGLMLAASCLLPRTGLVTTVGSALMLLLMRLLSAMSFSMICILAQAVTMCAVRQGYDHK